MTPTNSSNNVTWKMLSVLVVIAMAAIGAVATLGNVADGKLEKEDVYLKAADEKLDREKVDKEVYDQHVETDKEYRQRQDAQWEKIDKKLDKALGL